MAAPFGPAYVPLPRTENQPIVLAGREKVEVVTQTRKTLEENLKRICQDGKEPSALLPSLKKECWIIIQINWADILHIVFKHLDIAEFLYQNEEACTDTILMKGMQESIHVLFRYGINLLRPILPVSWEFISFDSTVYKSKVGRLKGHKKIFELYGYTKEMPYGVSYPKSSPSPNIHTVIEVAVDLAIVYYELDSILQSSHPFPQRVSSIIRSKLQRVQTPQQTLPVLHGRTEKESHSAGLGDGDRGFLSFATLDEPRTRQRSAVPIYENVSALPRASQPRQSGGPSYSGDFLAEIGNVVIRQKLPVMPEDWRTPSSSPNQSQEFAAPLALCGLCKQTPANMRCDSCSQPRCEKCDELWHKHRDRKGHTRHKIVLTTPAAPATSSSSSSTSLGQPKGISSGGQNGRSGLGVNRAQLNPTPDFMQSVGEISPPQRTIQQPNHSNQMHIIDEQSHGRMAHRSPEPRSHGNQTSQAEVECSFCSKPGQKFCADCGETYCSGCDEKRHSNPIRKGHRRRDVVQMKKEEDNGNVVEEETLTSHDVRKDSPLEDAFYSFPFPDNAIKAPPNDKYRLPTRQSTEGPGGRTIPSVVSPVPEWLEIKDMALRAGTQRLHGGGKAPNVVSNWDAERVKVLEAERDRIVAEDIDLMEIMASLRDLKMAESDPQRRDQLEQEEQENWQKHAAFQARQQMLEQQLRGGPVNSNQGKEQIIAGSSTGAFERVCSPVASQRRTLQGPSSPSGPLDNKVQASRAAASPVGQPSIQLTPQMTPPETSLGQGVASQLDPQGWTCQHCTFINTNPATNICEMCDKTSDRKPRSQQVVVPQEQLPTRQEDGPARRRRNAEYFQKLEEEILAEKQQAKAKCAESSEESGTGLDESPQPSREREQSRALTDTDLLELAKEISRAPGSPMGLGIQLGFSHVELTRILHASHTNPDRKTFEMLRMWRDDVRGRDQRTRLKQALVKAQLPELVHIVDEDRFSTGQESFRIGHEMHRIGRELSRIADSYVGVISDKELSELARKVPNNMVSVLGLYLGFDDARIETCLRDNRDGAFRLLVDWKRKTRVSDHRQELCKLLEHAGLRELSVELMESGKSGKAVVHQQQRPQGLSDREITDLADALGTNSKVADLGLFLGFSSATIHEYTGGSRLMGRSAEGTRRMLLEWRNMVPQDKQRDMLCSALVQIECKRLAEVIREPSGSVYPTGSPSQIRPFPETSFDDFSLIRDEEKKRYEELRIDSLALVAKLREAENEAIPAKRIKCALSLMQEDRALEPDQDPVQWTKTRLPELVKGLAQRVQQELKENLELDIDPRIMGVVRVSEESASDSLEDCEGDLEEALKDCLKKMQQKILELKDHPGFSTEELVAALVDEEVAGDAEKALKMLQAKEMAVYADRVWKTSDVTDNEFFQNAVKNDDRSIRMLMVEYNMRSWGRAQTAAKLIVRGEFEVEDVVIAAEECGDLRRSEEYLQQECSVCYMSLPRNKLMSLINCQCMMCRECVIQHFEIVARDKSIMKGQCPQCNMPDLNDQAVAADYFQFLDILLRDLLSDEVFALFQRKLRDWNLMHDPYFCWCAHCNSGFINGAPERRKMRCPECNQLTCFLCKKQWLEQHEGISCDAFQQWKEANDPDMQARGLAAHLNENGIECPRCKMRYELAKGGCMHFRCPQCTYEFCCGCNQAMKNGETCGRFASCGGKGLHAHHPRDCLFYLRDEEVTFLQQLLGDAKVEYNKEPPQGAQRNEGGVCGVKEQKEGPNGLEDDNCGRAVSPGHAGLCKLHYVEYLVGIINTKNIDPAKAFPVRQLEIILSREEVAVPPRREAESDPAYKKRLLAEVQRKLPLKKSPRERAR